MGYPAVSSHLLYCLSYHRSYSLSVIVLLAFNFSYFLLFAYACVSLHFFLLCMFWMSCNRIENRLFPYHLWFQSVRLPFSGCAEWTLTGFPNDCRTSHHFSASGHHGPFVYHEFNFIINRLWFPFAFLKWLQILSDVALTVNNSRIITKLCMHKINYNAIVYVSFQRRHMAGQHHFALFFGQVVRLTACVCFFF